VDAAARRVTGAHTYADDGAYTARVRVTDDDGASGEDTVTVAVANVAPALTALDITPTVVEGGVATLTGVFVDPGLHDPHTVLVDWGEGTPETLALALDARTFTLRHRYLDDDPSGTPSDRYLVRVRLADEDDAAVTAQVTTRVVNASPRRPSSRRPRV